MFARRCNRQTIEPDRHDPGFTLVEIVVSIALLGVIAASILPAVWTMVRASRATSTESVVTSTLGRARDLITVGGYTACPATDVQHGYESRAAGAASLVGWPVEAVRISDFEYFDNRTGRWTTTNPAEASGCQPQSSVSGAATMQRFVITVTSPDGEHSGSIEMIMGDLGGGDV